MAPRWPLTSSNPRSAPAPMNPWTAFCHRSTNCLANIWSENVFILFLHGLNLTSWIYYRFIINREAANLHDWGAGRRRWLIDAWFILREIRLPAARVTHSILREGVTHINTCTRNMKGQVKNVEEKKNTYVGWYVAGLRMFCDGGVARSAGLLQHVRTEGVTRLTLARLRLEITRSLLDGRAIIYRRKRSFCRGMDPNVREWDVLKEEEVAVMASIFKHID